MNRLDALVRNRVISIRLRNRYLTVLKISSALSILILKTAFSLKLCIPSVSLLNFILECIISIVLKNPAVIAAFLPERRQLSEVASLILRGVSSSLTGISSIGYAPSSYNGGRIEAWSSRSFYLSLRYFPLQEDVLDILDTPFSPLWECWR